jgi:Kdo2-lipid IVA lauroyltransferase/acyltransferase
MPWNVRLLALALRLGAYLPLRWLHALGAVLARLPAWFNTREYRVAQRNVALCFGELDAAGQRRLVKETLAETGKSMTELAWLWGGSPQRALATIRDVRGLEYVEAARAQGKGILFAAPHLGSWELLNLFLCTLGPLTILYRVPQSAEFEPLLIASRTSLGAEAVRAEASGVRLLFRRLKENRLVGILPDQRPKGGEGEDAPFYGHTAKTMTLLSRLAHKTGAPVVLGFAERLPRGAGFRVHFLPAEPAVASENLVEAVAALNRGIEACVRLAPAQYQWTYKRFSFRRKGDPPDRIYGKG